MQRPADIPKGRPQSETLVSVQCLRGVASFIVVASHAIGGYGVKYVTDS